MCLRAQLGLLRKDEGRGSPHRGDTRSDLPLTGPARPEETMDRRTVPQICKRRSRQALLSFASRCFRTGSTRRCAVMPCSAQGCRVCNGPAGSNVLQRCAHRRAHNVLDHRSRLPAGRAEGGAGQGLHDREPQRGEAGTDVEGHGRSSSGHQGLVIAAHFHGLSCERFMSMDDQPFSRFGGARPCKAP